VTHHPRPTTAPDDSPSACALLDAELTAAAAARRFVHGQLAGWACAEHADVAVLLVSEVVTNALQHTPSGRIRLTVSRRGRAVRCEVEDGSAEQPRLRTPQDGDEGGRGLLLVHRLATRWGSVVKGGGKTVWFELADRVAGP
jgi:anti-sigma regulatory factor (Ser/Thr protein kinase)